MQILERINDAILQPFVVLLMAVAVVYFLFGVMKFVKDQNSEDAQGDGKRHMVWGVVGLAIMVGVWGILEFISSFASEFTQ